MHIFGRIRVPPMIFETREHRFQLQNKLPRLFEVSLIETAKGGFAEAIEPLIFRIGFRELLLWGPAVYDTMFFRERTVKIDA